MKNRNLPSILFFLIGITILFLGFYRNQWNIVLHGKFKNFQLDDQSLVMGRLVETRQNGISTYGGLLGAETLIYTAQEKETYDYQKIYDHQYDAYLKGQNFISYDKYGSQSGVQGIFFGVLDRLSPFTPAENLRIYRVIVSLSFAFVIGYLLFWFLIEFGWSAAILALVTTAALRRG